MGVSGGVSVHVLGPDVTASHFRGTHWETWPKASCGLKGGGRSAINGPKVSGIQGEEEEEGGQGHVQEIYCRLFSASTNLQRETE